ncbi:hypothetical protein D3C85_1580710 [compost metagenome]
MAIGGILVSGSGSGPVLATTQLTSMLASAGRKSRMPRFATFSVWISFVPLCRERIRLTAASE